jgi:hypothetical protein
MHGASIGGSGAAIVVARARARAACSRRSH